MCADEFDAVHKFSDSANWLVPGGIMVGEYPFMNGSTCTDHKAGEKRLDQALRAGITAFAGMLSELPSQYDMPIGGVKNFVPYKPTCDLIAAGACFSATFMHSFCTACAPPVESEQWTQVWSANGTHASF